MSGCAPYSGLHLGVPQSLCGVREPRSRFGWAKPCFVHRMAAGSESASMAGALHNLPCFVSALDNVQDADENVHRLGRVAVHQGITARRRW